MYLIADSPAGRLTYVRQMTTELQAHSKALEEQTTKSARDVAILNEKDQEYARQGQVKSKEVCARWLQQQPRRACLRMRDVISF